MNEPRYYLSVTAGGKAHRVYVTKEEWVAAEQAAGFRGGRRGEPSTGGWGSGSLSGGIEYPQNHEPRRFERLANPLADVRKVRTGNGGVFTAMDDDGQYWSGRGWEQGVHWTALLGWGPLVEVLDA